MGGAAGRGAVGTPGGLAIGGAEGANGRPGGGAAGGGEADTGMAEVVFFEGGESGGAGSFTGEVLLLGAGGGSGAEGS